jgi:hypothetical protein
MHWSFVCFLFFLIFFPHAVFADQSIEISEVFPNPMGDDATLEWIELYNPGSMGVSLDGWSIADEYGTTKTFSLTGKSIAANSYLVLMRTETGITLNNDQELVTLISPTNQHISTPVITNILEGKSFAAIGGTWQWIDPTPNALNLAVSTTPTPVPSPTPTPSTLPSPSPTPSPSPSQTSIVPAIFLSEIQACNENEKEWIELVNQGDQEVTLDDWKVLDASNILASSLENIHILSHGFAVIELSGFHLNNGGDLVQLKYGEEIKDQFAYDRCSVGTTWEKEVGGIWRQSSCPTKGKDNMLCQTSENGSSPTPQPNVFVSTFAPTTNSENSSDMQKEGSSQIANTILPAFEIAQSSSESAHTKKVLGVQSKKNNIRTQNFTASIALLFGGICMSLSTSHHMLIFGKQLVKACYNLRG